MSKKLTIEYVKEYAKQFKYECLSKKYVEAHAKLKFKCPEGHIFESEWANFQQERRCPYCSRKKKRTIEEVKEYAKQFGYECLSNEYKNAYTRLKLKCDKDHIFEMTWTNFQQGYRCRQCYQENNRGENSPRWKNYTEEDIKRLNGYRDKIDQLTNQNFHKYYYLINPNKLPRNRHEYHTDHIYTIIDGFKNNISPEIIASPINLQMLTAYDNINKGGRSDMIKETLYDLYYQFEKEMNN